MNPYSDYDPYPDGPDGGQLRDQKLKTKWWIAPAVAVPVGGCVYLYIIFTFWLLILSGPLLVIVFLVAILISFTLGATYRNARPVGVGIIIGFAVPITWMFLTLNRVI
ncbi:MAG: hypothetical protein M3Y35_03360 [Actinomycetota bacterium]|nr:hypothetical protein [Actinomycetota bacterium]